MKFSIGIAFLTTLVASVSAHMSMSFPPTRAHPLNPNAATKDLECIMAPLNGGGSCPKKEFPCGGYPADKKVVTTFKAGQVIDVKFFNQNAPDPSKADPSIDQARHNGGLCEFALSYDGGNTYTKIATYRKTCPDIFFTGWKVKIPDSAPSCNKPGKCIFSWSWINAVGNREFYQNCADIKIVGNSTEPLPIIDITKANFPPLFTKIITPEGDDANTGNAKGSGPLAKDVKANLKLNIGGGKNNNDKPKKPKLTKPPKTDDPTKTSTSEPAAPTSSSTSEPAAPTETPETPSNDDNSNKDCKVNGSMTCVKSGTSPAFETCDNGKIVTRNCPGVLVCQTDNSSIVCKPRNT